MCRQRTTQGQARTGFAHCGARLYAIATERGDPEKAWRRRLEAAHEATVGNEGAQARPRSQGALNPHRRGLFDAIDRKCNVEVFRLHIVGPDGSHWQESRAAIRRPA
jgi:hypothetical protein